MKILKFLILILSMTSGVVLSDEFKKTKDLYKKKKYKLFTQKAYNLYIKTKKKSERIELSYLLGMSLKKLSLPLSSAQYLSKVITHSETENNKKFQKSFEALAAIDYKYSLNRRFILQILKRKIEAAYIPGKARGFYFFYKAISLFESEKYQQARGYFKRVQPDSSYYIKALFHLAVIETLSGHYDLALKTLDNVKRYAVDLEKSAWIVELANLNIARINYEKKDYHQALRYYSLIPRYSENWLQALFEASWAFFIMEKTNNTLGNIHTLLSPFFINRFFPEAYILQATTFLRTCHYKQAKKSISIFKGRFRKIFKDIKSLLKDSKKNKLKIYSITNSYYTSKLTKYQNASSVIDALSRQDAFRGVYNTVALLNVELLKIEDIFSSSSAKNTFADKFKKNIKKFSLSLKKHAGSYLWNEAKRYYDLLKSLNKQTDFIKAELMLGTIEGLRSNVNIKSSSEKTTYIGGLKELKVGGDLEYWPFEDEYWEDDLGYYVFNIKSLCKGAEL